MTFPAGLEFPSSPVLLPTLKISNWSGFLLDKTRKLYYYYGTVNNTHTKQENEMSTTINAKRLEALKKAYWKADMYALENNNKALETMADNLAVMILNTEKIVRTGSHTTANALLRACEEHLQVMRDVISDVPTKLVFDASEFGWRPGEFYKNLVIENTAYKFARRIEEYDELVGWEFKATNGATVVIVND